MTTQIIPSEAKNRKNKAANFFLILLLLGLLGGGGSGGYFLWRDFDQTKKALAEKRYDEALERLERFNFFSYVCLGLLGNDLAYLYRDLAMALIRDNEFQKCLTVLDRAIARFPLELLFPAIKARAYYGLGEREKATDAINHVLNSPFFSKEDSERQSTFYSIAALIHGDSFPPEATGSYIEKVTDLTQKEGEDPLLIGSLYAVKKDFAGMLLYYEKLAKTKREMLQWQDYFLMGIGYLSQNDILRFQKCYAKARQQFPTAPGFHLLLSLKFLKESNYASSYYELFFEKETGLANISFFEPALAELENQFKAAFKRRPSEPWLNSTYLFIQGRQMWEAGKTKEALAFVQQSIQGENIHPLQYLYLARILKSLGRLDEALSYYGMVLEKLGNLSRALAESAEIYLERGDLQASQSLWEKAVSTDPAIVQFSEVGKRLRTINPSLPFPVVPDLLSALAAAPSIQAELNQIVITQFTALLNRI